MVNFRQRVSDVSFMMACASWLTSLSTESNYQPGHILDSIANISVSKAKGEVVAVAVQVGKTDTKLIVASNGALPDSTITYLKEIWNMLMQLSKDYDPMSGRSIQYTNKDLEKDAQMRIVNLRRKILRFCHQRLRRRISKYFSNFISLKGVQAEVLGLEPTIKQIEALKPALDQPALADKTCDLIWLALVHIRCRLHRCSVRIENFENTQDNPFHVSRYLSKIVSIYEDFTFLMQTARRPPLNDIWQLDFQIINVKGSGDIPSNPLKSRVPWTQLVDDILRLRNMAAEEKGLRRYALNKTDVRQHVVKMCQTPLRKAQFVHCELKIVSYILQSSEQGFLDYIGISKICCNGCVQFLQAVKSVLGQRFSVKVAPRMFHYPWAFPDIPHAASVGKQMSKTVAFEVGQVYRGFRPEKKRRLYDSSYDEAIDISDDPEDRSRAAMFRRGLRRIRDMERAKKEECEE